MSYEPADIKALRQRLQLTQDGLADEIGVDRSNVSRWEAGVTKPRGAALKLLDAIAKRPTAEVAA